MPGKIRCPRGLIRSPRLETLTVAIVAEAVFITIPLSHYCEKARWGLDRTRLPYLEDPHVPMLSRLATRRHEGGTVPMLIHGDMRLTDSTDILVHADACAGGDVLYPRDTQLVATSMRSKSVSTATWGPRPGIMGSVRRSKELNQLFAAGARRTLAPPSCTNHD